MQTSHGEEKAADNSGYRVYFNYNADGDNHAEGINEFNSQLEHHGIPLNNAASQDQIESHAWFDQKNKVYIFYNVDLSLIETILSDAKKSLKNKVSAGIAYATHLILIQNEEDDRIFQVWKKMKGIGMTDAVSYLIKVFFTSHVASYFNKKYITSISMQPQFVEDPKTDRAKWVLYGFVLGECQRAKQKKVSRNNAGQDANRFIFDFENFHRLMEYLDIVCQIYIKIGEKEQKEMTAQGDWMITHFDDPAYKEFNPLFIQARILAGNQACELEEKNEEQQRSAPKGSEARVSQEGMYRQTSEEDEKKAIQSSDETAAPPTIEISDKSSVKKI